jgi:ABC-type glycerol-3-phosphate transport system substrate-binding protein
MRAPTRQPKKRRLKRVWHRRPATRAAMAALVIIDVILFALGMRLKTELLTIAVYEGIEGEPLKQVAQRFSDATGTRVQILEFPYEKLYEEEMLSLTATSESRLSRFDVIMLDDPWLESLLGDNPKPGSLRLSQLCAPEKADADDFFTSCLRVGQHPYCDSTQGSCSSAYYGMPFVGNSQLLCYRDPDHANPPSTWAEIAGLSEKAGSRPRNTGRGQPALEPSYAMRLGPRNSIVTDFIPMLWASDPGGPGEPDRFASAARAPLRPKTREAFLQFAKLSAGRNFGTKSLDDFDLAVYMAEGKATTSIIWSAYAMALANLGSAASGVKDLQFGAVPGRPVLGAWLLAAPSNRHKDQQDLAKNFIAFATSRMQLAKAAADGNPPPRKSALTSDTFRARYPQTLLAAQQESLERAWPRPRWADWTQVELRIGACLSDLSAGLIGADDALDAINLAIRATPGQQPVAGRGAGCAGRAIKTGDSRRP